MLEPVAEEPKKQPTSQEIAEAIATTSMKAHLIIAQEIELELRRPPKDPEHHKIADVPRVLALVRGLRDATDATLGSLQIQSSLSKPVSVERPEPELSIVQ